MRKITVAFSILLLPLHLHLAAAQSTPIAQEGPVQLAPKPALEGPVSQVEGSWRLAPSVLKGAPAPETNGQFQEFGVAYVLENALLFWGRFGAGDKDWGLFSLSEGKLSKVLLADVEFVAPDARKIRIRRDGSALFHAGNRMLYISNRDPDHVYGWNGERMVRVLCAGDQLEVSGVRYTVKRATVLDVGPDGRALIYYDTNEPQHVDGWVLHDGASFTPLWKEGDSLPGMPGVQIKNLSAGHFCIFNCVGAPRLLEDSSILAPLEVTGAPYKKALFRIMREKTEKVVGEKERDLGTPYIERLGEVLVARSDSFVMDVSESGSYPQGGYLVYYLIPKLLFYHRGKFRVESFVGAREYGVWGGRDVGFAFDRGIFLGPDSPRLLVTLKVSKTKVRIGLVKNKRTDISFPGLYFWDEEKLSPVPWETALGMDIPTALKALEAKPEHYWSPAQAKMIGLWRISGPVSGVGVLLPTGGSNGARWFVGSNSVNGKLEQSPQFQVAGRTVTAANVVAWRGPKEALVELEDGFFLLTKTTDVK
jgi:hypothetical protein